MCRSQLPWPLEARPVAFVVIARADANNVIKNSFNVNVRVCIYLYVYACMRVHMSMCVSVCAGVDKGS